jgi:hypothetical protein
MPTIDELIHINGQPRTTVTSLVIAAVEFKSSRQPNLTLINTTALRRTKHEPVDGALALTTVHLSGHNLVDLRNGLLLSLDINHPSTATFETGFPPRSASTVEVRLLDQAMVQRPRPRSAKGHRHLLERFRHPEDA